MTPFAAGVIWFLKIMGYRVLAYVLVMLYGFVLLLETLPEAFGDFIRQRREGVKK